MGEVDVPIAEEVPAAEIVPSAVVEAVQHGRLTDFIDFLQSSDDKGVLPVIDAQGCSLLHW
jgi:hypothetical protein